MKLPLAKTYLAKRIQLAQALQIRKDIRKANRTTTTIDVAKTNTGDT